METAKLLKEKINEAKQLGKSPRVDIVAHSMGGLVARQYIESDDYQNDVFHLVTLGTPHNGSPNAYLMWEGGVFKEEIIGSRYEKFIESIKKIYFFFEAKENGYNTIHKYIREKIPSVKELMPIYNYLREAETGNIKSYPNDYPRNEFLENLNSEENLLNKFLKRPNLEVINIAGVEKENSSVDTIRVIELPEKFKDPENLLWPHGYPEGLDKSFGDHGLELGEGDGTVPLKSAMIDGYPITFPYTHHEMATETFDKVFYYLNNTNPIKPVPIRRPPLKRLLFFRLHSPVDFQIIDPAGNKIGKDFASNAVINQITDAFYSGFNTDMEFITIPDPIDGEYKIITQGTDNGSFELTISSIDEEKTDEQSYQSTTQPNQEDNLKVEYSQNKEHPLKPITSTNEEYTIDDLTVKLKDYYKNNSIKDRYIYHYFKHLLRGVEIGVKRISQVQEEIEEINQRPQEPNLKPHKKEALEYRKWLYQQRIIFHQTIIKRNLNTFINKINQYQPELIEPEAAQDLTRMAQIILARYE